MQPWIEPLTLTGAHAVLEPLGHEHVDGLGRAARDGELWNLWFTSVPSPEETASYVVDALAMREREGAQAFAVRSALTGEVLGSTRYFHVDAKNRRLEIGHTWYALSHQRTAVNTECKWLLLRHAFESLDATAVELRTHVMNQRSRRAIERLGAKLDGILRHHMILKDGTLRDTAVYSILAVEWPTVRQGLVHALQRTR